MSDINNNVMLYVNFILFILIAVSTGTSFVLSSLISVLLFSAMQIYKPWLGSTQLNTILGGYLGSVLFIFVLTVSFSKQLLTFIFLVF